MTRAAREKSSARFPSEWVVRWAWPIIVGFVALGASFALPLRRLAIDPEIKNQLPVDMASRRDVRAIEERFGGSELVMLVVQAPDVLQASTLERVQKLSRALAGVAGVERVVSPFSLTDLRGTADGMLSVEPAIPSIPTTGEAREALRARLADNPFVIGNVVAPDFTAASVIGLLSSEAKDAETVAALRRVVAEVPGPEPTLSFGMPVVREQVSEDIRSDIRRFAPAGVLAMLAFLWLSLRQVHAVLIPFGIQLLAIVVSMGLIPMLGWKLQMVTVTLPVMLLAIGNDHTVHLMARYQEARQQAASVPGQAASAPALAARVLGELAFPMLTAGITTVAGFLCLLTHVVVPAAQLGVLASVGLGLVMLAAVSLAPAILAKLPLAKPIAVAADAERVSRLDRWLGASARFVTRRKAPVVGASVALGLLASAGLPWLRVDTNPINYYPPSAPVAEMARAVNAHFGGATEIAVMVEGDIRDPVLLGKIDRLEGELRALPQVGYTMSLAGVLRRMQRAVSGTSELPGERATIAQLLLLHSLGGDAGDLEQVVDFDYRHALLTARVNSLSTQDISAVVARAKEFARRELGGHEVTVGGFGAVFAELVGAVVDGQLSSLGASFVIVLLLNALGFWSLEAGAWSMLPLCVAVPALFGLMGTFGIELNVVTAMLSSIMIGVGVDYTVHFLWRFREERRAGHPAEQAAYRSLTGVGRGIVFNALAVVVGFSVLGFSNFLPVRFFGFLVVVSISACLIAAMALMPALVVWFDPRFARAPEKPALKPAAGRPLEEHL
jgi:hydrophobe/amphiphile efflux-3 (HAE3) family protein